MEQVGIHIQKKGEFIKSLKAFYEEKQEYHKPTQLFTGSPKFWRRNKLNLDDIIATRKYINEHNLSIFIHSIYLINLSKPPEVFQEKAQDCLAYELNLGFKIGFKGVIVHCGKALKLGEPAGIDYMVQNIISLYEMELIHKECPLLIETSAGQGSEVCHEYAILKDMYRRFTPEQCEYIKICIDTCHVFAAGHDPEEFIINWNNDFPGSIVLVHFNDSKEALGKRKDRHEWPGKGHIGIEKLTSIAKWLKENNIPAVIEM